MKLIASLLSTLAMTIAPAVAGSKVKAVLFGHDGDGDSHVSPRASIKIKLQDEDGAALGNLIDTRSSGAMEVSRWTLQWTGEDGAESFPLSGLKRYPASGSHAAELVAVLPEDLGKASLGKKGWRLSISGTSASPALVLLHPGGHTEKQSSVVVEVPPISSDDQEIIDRFEPIAPTLSLGGGEDGALFGIEFAYQSAARRTDDNQLYGAHAKFKGMFTPDPDESLLMYGRYSGDLGVFRTWGIPRNDVATGSLHFDLNTRFESDQQTDNYNWSLGAGVWGYIGLKPVTLFSKGLYSVVNLGRKEMDEPPILTTFLGYEYLAVSEQEASSPEQGNNRFRFLTRYRTPLWRDLDLLLVPTRFDVDAVVDFSGVWDLDSNRVLPEVEAAVEFMPKPEDGKLAFSISYVSGKIAPVFVDEDAFLAALKYRF